MIENPCENPGLAGLSGMDTWDRIIRKDQAAYFLAKCVKMKDISSILVSCFIRNSPSYFLQKRDGGHG